MGESRTAGSSRPRLFPRAVSFLRLSYHKIRLSKSAGCPALSSLNTKKGRTAKQIRLLCVRCALKFLEPLVPSLAAVHLAGSVCRSGSVSSRGCFSFGRRSGQNPFPPELPVPPRPASPCPLGGQLDIPAVLYFLGVLPEDTCAALREITEYTAFSQNPHLVRPPPAPARRFRLLADENGDYRGLQIHHLHKVFRNGLAPGRALPHPGRKTRRRYPQSTPQGGGISPPAFISRRAFPGTPSGLGEPKLRRTLSLRPRPFHGGDDCDRLSVQARNASHNGGVARKTADPREALYKIVKMASISESQPVPSHGPEALLSYALHMDAPLLCSRKSLAMVFFCPVWAQSNPQSRAPAGIPLSGSPGACADRLLNYPGPRETDRSARFPP